MNFNFHAGASSRNACRTVKLNIHVWAPAALQPLQKGKMRTSSLIAGFMGLVILAAMNEPLLAQDFTYTTGNGAITITGYTGPGGNVIIPDTINNLPVTTIGDQAFSEVRTMTALTVGENVTTIGQQAFYECNELVTVSLGNRVATIGIFAFSRCTNLTSIALPDSVLSLGRNAFTSCKALATVRLPNGLTRVEPYTFHDCDSLLSMEIPDTVISIGTSAFGDCRKLARVIIGSRVATLEDMAFYNCPDLTEVSYYGNAPMVGQNVFAGALATIYYLPGTQGWTSTLAGRPTQKWLLPYPVILTGDPGFGIQATSFGFRVSWAASVPVAIEASASPSGAEWVTLGTKALSDGWDDFKDFDWGNHQARYYRIRVH
jgi:hypothetical protein